MKTQSEKNRKRPTGTITKTILTGRRMQIRPKINDPVEGRLNGCRPAVFSVLGR